jgi:hypothetical protein
MNQPPIEIWNQLNDRQKQYLKLIFQIDQEVEAYEKAAFSRGSWVRPASEWRWLEYGETAHGPTLLKRMFRSNKLIDPGTGSTFAALEQRNLIEVRSYGSKGANLGVSTARVEVKMTPHGRKVVRTAFGIQLEKKLPPGTLRDDQWQAFADCYASGAIRLSKYNESGQLYQSGSYGDHS